MRHLFVGKVLTFLSFCLLFSLENQAQSFVDYLQKNKADSVKIKKYFHSNLILKEEYKNVLVCSCINEFQKLSILKNYDSCISKTNGIGSLVFDEILYSKNLRSLHNSTLTFNIDLFNSQILLPDIKQIQQRDEYGVIQISVLSHCKKVVKKQSPKYYQLLLANPISLLVPWLYK